MVRMVRGGVAKLDEGHRLAALWQALPEELRLSPHRYLATNSPQGPWWLLGWCERVPEADEVLPAPLPPYRVLTGLVDRFGRTQTFHREAGGAQRAHQHHEAGDNRDDGIGDCPAGMRDTPRFNQRQHAFHNPSNASMRITPIATRDAIMPDCPIS